MLTPQGRPLRQRDLARLASLPSVAFVCGRYEGFDERARAYVDDELTLGDYVLNGGEVAAMVVLDGIVRLLPGVVGNPESLVRESHADLLLEYPQYTRPAEFRGDRVPDVLLSGDHAAIARWRRRQAMERTRARRPDVWERFVPTEEDKTLLEEPE
jgi:tRNA (guanine37-N1)-methyltransferase